MNKVDTPAVTQTMITTGLLQAEKPETTPVVKPVTATGTNIEQTSVRRRRAESVLKPTLTGDLTQDITTVFDFIRNKSELAPAVICRMDDNGILGKLFDEAPRSALALCRARLDALHADLKSFSDYANVVTGRKTLAVNMLAELETALTLADTAPAEFIALLNTYDATFDKVSLQNILTAKFLKITGSDKLNPLTINKEGIFFNVEEMLATHMHMAGTVTLLSDGFDAEDFLREQDLVRAHADSHLTEASLLNSYILAFPKMIKQMIVTWTSAALLNSDDEDYRALAKNAADVSADPHKISTLLKANDDMLNDVTVDISRMHIGRIYAELKDFNTNTASVEALLDAREQCRVFDLLQKNFDEELSTAEVVEQKTCLKDKQAAIQARLIADFTESEAKKPEAQRLFWLKPVKAGQARNKLSVTELWESSEARLYKRVVAYVDALQNFKASGNHANLIKMQQCRFDLLRTQQEHLVVEMKDRIAGRDTTSLGQCEHKADMQLLDTIHECRQATARFRPVETMTGNASRLMSNVIWRDELSLTDIKAGLAHEHALKQLGYNFMSELGSAAGTAASTGVAIGQKMIETAKKGPVQTAKDGANKVTKVAGEVADKVSDMGFFEAVGIAKNTYRGLEASLTENLERMLQVAERNPVGFRRMCGDFAQVLPQLKKLFGMGNGELNSLLDQVSARLTAESAASCFAGDEALNLDQEITKDSQLGKDLTRFQFYCDLASLSLHLTTGANSVLSALQGSVAGVTGALFNYGAMMVTRETVNRMPADEVRMLDKLFRYGPVLGWVTTSPFDVMATTARNIGQNHGIVSSLCSAVFAPYTRRLNALTEAMTNVWNHKPGAWAQLALEGTKSGAILAAAIGVTAVAATTVCATGPLGMVGCAYSLAGMTYMAVSASYCVARLITHMEDNNILFRASKGLAMFKAQLFSEKSMMTKSIRLRCEQEAANLVVAMKNQDAYTQQTTDLAARRMFQQHWDLVSEKATHEAGVADFLNQNQKRRIEQAEFLVKQVGILEIVEANIDEADKITADKQRCKALKSELEALDVEFFVPEAGLDHYLLNLKLQATATLEKQSGTHKPGKTTETVAAYLAEYQREVLLGNVVRETLKEQKSPEVAKVTTAAETALYKTTTKRIGDIEKKRVELMLMKALEEYLVGKEAEGETITAADLERKDMERILKPIVDRNMKQLRTVNAQWVDSFKAQLKTNSLMKGASKQSRDNAVQMMTAAAA